jgi:hypothetical protein
LRSIAKALAPHGELIVAVPPVLSEADLRVHATNRDHRSNLSVRAWAELFESEGWAYRFISHRCAKPLDFSSFRASTIAPADFDFVEESVEAAYRFAPITAIYRLRLVG